MNTVCRYIISVLALSHVALVAEGAGTAEAAAESLRRHTVTAGEWTVSTMRPDELPEVIYGSFVNDDDGLSVARRVLYPLIVAAELKHKQRFIVYFKGDAAAARSLWWSLVLAEREIAVTGIARHHSEDACIIAYYTHDGLNTGAGQLLFVRDGFIRDPTPKRTPEICRLLEASFKHRPGIPAVRGPSFQASIRFAQRVNASDALRPFNRKRQLLEKATDTARKGDPIRAHEMRAEAMINTFLVVHYDLPWSGLPRDQEYVRRNLLVQEIFTPPRRYHLQADLAPGHDTPLSTLYTVAQGMVEGNMKQVKACFEEPFATHFEFWYIMNLQTRKLNGIPYGHYLDDLVVLAGCRFSLADQNYVQLLYVMVDDEAKVFPPYEKHAGVDYPLVVGTLFLKEGDRGWKITRDLTRTCLGVPIISPQEAVIPRYPSGFTSWQSWQERAPKIPFSDPVLERDLKPLLLRNWLTAAQGLPYSTDFTCDLPDDQLYRNLRLGPANESTVTQEQ